MAQNQIPERRFYLKISGSAWGIVADSPEAAVEQIKSISGVFCTISALEIGVDVDENGYDLTAQKTFTKVAK